MSVGIAAQAQSTSGRLAAPLSLADGGRTVSALIDEQAAAVDAFGVVFDILIETTHGVAPLAFYALFR